MQRNVNFGCGLDINPNWVNYDGSPNLRLQKLPILGALVRKFSQPLFPSEVIYGDVIKGLPELDHAVDNVYSSHVLEHLSLNDFRSALREVHRILKPGGIFRGVVPDLEYEINSYIANKDVNACSEFMRSTYLGFESSRLNYSKRLKSLFGTSTHLWMWDWKGLEMELRKSGFINMRRAHFGDSNNIYFQDIENEARWEKCLGFECKKNS